jgi:hypothetical protein
MRLPNHPTAANPATTSRRHAESHLRQFAEAFDLKLMEKIPEGANTEVPAYLALVREGFRVERHIIAGHEEWLAKRGNVRISGSSTVELLGLSSMRDQRGPEWKATDTEIAKFLELYRPDRNEPAK